MKKAEAWKITSNLLVYCKEFTIHMETNVFTEENCEKMYLGTDDWQARKNNWKLHLRFQVSLMYEVIAEMEEVVKADRGFSNNRLHFVHNDLKVLVDFGGEGIFSKQL